MGTRGFIVYRFKGRYYAHYNHWDSYPDGLGKKLVGHVPKDPEEYQAWLNKLKTKYGEIEEDMELEHWTIIPGDKQSEGVVDGRHDLEGFPTIWPPQNDLFIEWVYTFDLDREIFSVQNTHHFKLSDIPEDWDGPFKSSWEIKEEWKKNNNNNNEGNNDVNDEDEDIDEDEEEGYDRDEWEPLSYESTDDHPATISLERPQSPDQVAVDKFNNLRRRIVKSKPFTHLPSGKKSAVNFAKRLHERWIHVLGKDLDFLLVQWDSADETFRDICFVTLCLFADPQVTLSLQQHSYMSWTAKGPAIIHHSPSTSEMVTGLFPPFHLPGETRRFCPAGDVFWMHGVLVHLLNRLDEYENVEAGIVALVEGATKEGVASCHGIVMSVTRVILVRIFADGRVEHTRPMNFSKSFDDSLNALAAMAHIFEAAQREKLSLKRSSCVLPPELMVHILDEVTDRPTWLNCLKVSRFFRDTCQKKFLIKDRASISDDGETCTLITPADHGGKPVEYSFKFIPPSSLNRRRNADDATSRSTAASQIPVLGYDGQQRVMLKEVPMLFERESEGLEIDFFSSSPAD